MRGAGPWQSRPVGRSGLLGASTRMGACVRGLGHRSGRRERVGRPGMLAGRRKEVRGEVSGPARLRWVGLVR